MDRIRVETSDGINLIGVLYKTQIKSNNWILFFGGTDGNFITNEFIHKLGEESSHANYNFICAHNRGSFQLLSSQFIKEKKKSTQIGSAFEKFDDCIFDIEAWINYAISQKASKIILIGHSLGCNKILYYLSLNNSLSLIDNVILLSPIDLRSRMLKRYDINDLEHLANEYKQNNSEKQLLCCGFFYKNYSSFYDVIKNPNIDNFPIISEINNSFRILDYLKYNISIIYGDLEKKYVKNFFKKRDLIKSNKFILKNADHIYSGMERELSDLCLCLVNKTHDKISKTEVKSVG